MSQPPADAPIQVIKFWLEGQLLSTNEFSKQALHNVMMRMKEDEEERHHFMAAINDRDASTLCASFKSSDTQKRISVTVVSHQL